MAYPKSPLQDYERAFEMGKDIEPPAIPMAPLVKVSGNDGGAPRLPEVKEPRRPVWETKRPELPVKGDGPYWMRTPAPQAPVSHTLAAPVSWKREDIEKTHGEAIKQLGDQLWERYQTLSPQQKALPAWQQVAQNPHQAAYTIMTRALANSVHIGSGLTSEAAKRIQQGYIYRWLMAVGGE